MTTRSLNLLKLSLAWFAAGAGWDLQGRVLDHFLDAFVASHPFLAFLASQ